MTEVDRTVADLEGLPRKNGELAFDAPWQSRVFGMAVALNERGIYEWNDFRERLVVAIGQQPEAEYYASWLDAFERLMLDRRAVTPEEVRQRTSEFQSMERTEVY